MAAETHGPRGIADAGSHMAAGARDWLEALTQLATLEVRYSMRAGLAALVASLVLGAVLFSGWALILVIVSLALTSSGMSWLWALIVVGVVNLGLAVSLGFAVRRFITHIGLDATRRALGLNREREKATHDRPAQTHPAG